MPGERRYLGFAEEDTFGSAKDAAAFIDYLSVGLEAPSEPILFYEGAGSRGMSLTEPGPYVPSGDIEFGVDSTQVVYFLKWALGRYGVEGTEPTSASSTTLATAASVGDTTIEVNDEAGFGVDDYVQISDGLGGDVVKIVALDGGGGPTYTWTTTAPLNRHDADVDVVEVESPFKHLFRPTKDRNLPSFTARIGKDVFEHVFAGVTIDRLAFTADQGFLTCRMSVQAQKDLRGSLNDGTKAFPSDLFTFRTAVSLVNDVDESRNVESFSLEIANNIDPAAGVRFSSRFPREFPIQGADVTGSLTMAFANTDEYQRFWGAANEPAESGASSIKLEQQFQVGDNRLQFILGSVFWTQVSTPVSGRGRINQTINFRSVEDSTWDVVHVETINTKGRY